MSIGRSHLLRRGPLGPAHAVSWGRAHSARQQRHRAARQTS